MHPYRLDEIVVKPGRLGKFFVVRLPITGPCGCASSRASMAAGKGARCTAGRYRVKTMPWPGSLVTANVPARLPVKAEHLAQAQAGALADFLGRVKGLEDHLELVGSHAAAGVTNGNCQNLPG
jgi:hypothetical protein